MRTLISGVALLLLAAPAYAQNTPDARWSRWTGCWDLVTENSRDGAPSATPTRELRTPPRDAGRPQVCVVTSPDGGATFSTKVATQTPIVQTIVADGKDRPITEAECTGTQRSEWSSNGLHLYQRAELTCKGDQGTRRVSGLALIGPDGRWTDVQAVEIAGRESFRVRQYRRALGDPAVVPKPSASSLTLDDIKEASAKVSPRALEAALVETRASFELTSKRLLDLNAASVPASVIDLIVALSYPDRFVVERNASVDRASVPIVDDPFMLGWAFGFPVWSDLYGLYSPLYGPYSPYYYSPFAYPYLRGYYPGFYGNGYLIDNGGGIGGGGAIPERPSGLGRVVDGQGYTRVRPRDSEPVVTSRSPGDTSASSSGGGSSSSSGGSSGGSTVTSQGFSSGGGGGGSSDGGGRTAQPR